MEPFTKKVCGVTALFLITAVVSVFVVFALMSTAHAQEFQADVTFITQGSCGVMPNGKLFTSEEEKPKSTPQPCQVWEDAKDANIRYVFLADEDGNVTRVLQLNRETKEQKEVWKKTAGLNI